MADQLFYTFSPVGLGGALGFQVRAASGQLRDRRNPRIAALDPYLRYVLLQGGVALAPDEAPVCLALVDTGHERAVVHKVSLGKDYTGRPGNYFIHVVAGLPAEFTAAEAIELWGSNFWHRSDPLPASENMLSEIRPSDIPKGTLDLSDLESRIAQYYLPSLLEAYLSRHEGQHLYISASAEDAAVLIYGLTHTLPACLLPGLTFSTYEANPDQAPQQIVGLYGGLKTSRPSGTGPVGSTFEERGILIDCNVPPETIAQDRDVREYAKFVGSELRSADGRARLEAIRTLANGAQLSDTGSFLTAYRRLASIVKPPWSDEGRTLILTTPGVAKDMLAFPAFQKDLLELSSDDTARRDKIHARLLALRVVALTKPDDALQETLDRLADYTVEKVESWRVNGDQRRASDVWKAIALPISSKASNQLWTESSHTGMRHELTQALVKAVTTYDELDSVVQRLRLVPRVPADPKGQTIFDYLAEEALAEYRRNGQPKTLVPYVEWLVRHPHKLQEPPQRGARRDLADNAIKLLKNVRRADIATISQAMNLSDEERKLWKPAMGRVIDEKIGYFSGSSQLDRLLITAGILLLLIVISIVAYRVLAK